MDKVKIRLIVSRDGVGIEGDIFDVDPFRADRWVNNGLAEYLEDFVPDPEDEEIPEPPIRRRRGRPPKVREEI